MTTNLKINLKSNERRAAIDKSLKALKHHFSCSDKTCPVIACKKILRLHQHLGVCSRTKLTCCICKQFLALISLHSQSCNISSCPIPNCPLFKEIRAKFLR